MKLVTLYILAMPLALLAFAAASMMLKSAATYQPGPHGLSEVLYNFASATQQQRLGVRLPGHRHPVVHGDAGHRDADRPVLPDHPGAGRGWFAGRQTEGADDRAGRCRPTPRCSASWSLGVVFIVAGLTFFPALALGPILEHLSI